MPRLAILVVGDPRRAEFREVPAAVAPFAPPVVVPTVPDALRRVAEGWQPDLIVLLQSYPGEHAPAAVEQLRGLAPLARVVVVVGAWCEGETRSGRPLPGTVRVGWAEFPLQAARELRQMLSGETGAWSLPSTASEEERLLAVPYAPAASGGSIVVVAADEHAVRQWLVDACRDRGYVAIGIRPDEAVPASSAGIFDGDQCRGHEERLLREFIRGLHGAPVVAIFNFPRTDDRDRARRAGATAVLGKPIDLDDLFDCLT